MSLNDLLDEHVNRIREARAMTPPTVVNGPVDQPYDLHPDEEEGIRNDLLNKAAKGIGLIGRTAATPFTMTAEGLARADDAYRVTILTAMGKMPAEKYGQYFQEAISGKRRISGDEFNRLAFGQVAWEQMRNSKVRLPEWVKMWMVPDRYVTQNKDGSKDMAVGSAFLGAASEVFVSPFAVGSLLPRTALSATKAGRVLVSAVDAPTTALIAPFRAARWAALHPQNPFSIYLMQALGPETVLGKKLPEGVRLLVDNDDTYRLRVSVAHKKIVDSLTPYKDILKDGKTQDRVLRHLFEKDMKLVGQEKQIADDLWAKFGSDIHTRAAAMKYDVGKGGVKWDPDQYFRQFSPAARNSNLGQIRPIVEQGMPGIVRMDVPWKANPLPKDWTEYTDVADAMSNFAAVWEKKLTFDERTFGIVRTPVRANIVRDAVVDPERGLSREAIANEYRLWRQNKVEAWVEREVPIPIGFMAKYAPKTGWRAKGENPLLKDLDFREYEYLKKTAVVIAGNRASKLEIGFNNITERLVHSLDMNVKSAARKSRILSVLYDKHILNPTDLPTRLDAATATMVSGTMISALGLNLASAVHNMGQLLNTAAVHGIGPVMKGVFKMASLGDEGKVLRGLRKEARFNSAFEQMIFDESLRSQFGRRMTDFFMKPFNSTEMFVRGVAYNVGLEKALKKRGLSLADAVKGRVPDLQSAMLEAKRASLDTNFVYGIAGRGPLMANPVARVAFALQSFSIKEAEFLARTFDRDGGAVMKWVNLNGWAIDMTDKLAGINTESWLGWGFVPPTSFGRGPQVETAMNLVRMLNARSEGDVEAYEQAAQAARGNLNEVARMVGADGHAGAEIFAQSMGMLGVLPVPVIGIARTAKAYNEFMTGQRYERGERYFRPVTQEEAAQSWFFTTHRTYADQQLAAMEKTLRAQVGAEQDQRAKKFVRALKGKSGDEVWAAAQELATPVSYRLPFAHSRGIGISSLLFRLGDEDSFWAPGDMIQTRVKNLMKGAMVPRAVLEMDEAGWTSQILFAAYMNSAFRELEQGGIIPLQGGSR